MAVSALGCAACRPPVTTVQGPESPHLAASVRGHLVWSEPRGGIAAMSLPDGKRFVVRAAVAAAVPEFSATQAISGPDADGRIVCIEERSSTDATAAPQRLVTFRLDGTEATIVFESPGSAVGANAAAGHREIGSHIALSPAGGKAVVLRRVVHRQMRGSLLREGVLEFWDVVQKVPTATNVAGLDYPMAWLPDIEHLLYVALVPRNGLGPGTPGLLGLGVDEQSWDALPAIHLLDVATGRREFLCLGSEVVVAPDGKTAWVGGFVGQTALSWTRIDLESRAVRAVTLPGLADRVIAAPGSDLLVYWGWPTAGTTTEWSSLGSRSGGRQLLAIKVADPHTGAFATLVPALHPLTHVSFGARR